MALKKIAELGAVAGGGLAVLVGLIQTIGNPQTISSAWVVAAGLLGLAYAFK